MTTPAFWNAFNNAAAVKSPLTTFYDARRRRDVGDALSTGDYGAGARAAYTSGMIDEGLSIDRMGAQRTDDERQRQQQDAERQRQQTADAQAATDRARTEVLSRLQGLRYADPTDRGARFDLLKQSLLSAGADAAELDQLAADGIDDGELDQLIAEFGGDPGQDAYRDAQRQALVAAANRPQRPLVINGRAYEPDETSPSGWREVIVSPPQARPSSGGGGGRRSAPAGGGGGGSAPPWMRTW